MYLCCALIVAWIAGRTAVKFGLPDFLGILIIGIACAPYLPHIAISSPARTFALIVILLRAGLGMNSNTIRLIGWPAIKLGSIPCLTEGFTITLIAPYLLPINYLEAMCLGFVIAAVSPAVIVPAMLEFSSKGVGQKKQIPNLVLAGASLDDIFTLTIFGATINALSTGQDISFSDMLVSIPTQILIGIIIGLGTAWILHKIYAKIPKQFFVLISCLIASGFLYWLEKQHLFPMTSLLGIMAIGFYLNEHSPHAKPLSNSLNSIWNWVKILLFFFIGTEVNISSAINGGLIGIAIIAIGLMGRSIGMWVALLKTNLSNKEKLFCLISHIPKATVQAAIGAVALTLVTNGTIKLSNGIATGELILNLAVLSILITAPIGSVLISKFGERLLKSN